MDDEGFPITCDLDDDDITESINIDRLFAEVSTSTGSFRLTGVRASSLGKLLDALPMPAILIEASRRVFFGNESWSDMCGGASYAFEDGFKALFEEPQQAEYAARLLDQAFEERKPLSGEVLLTLPSKRMWVRLHLRTLRTGSDRYALVLVQDLTAERRQLYLTKKHSAELRKAHDDMERRVEERTAQLLQANQRLKAEIAQRNRAEEELRLSEERYRSLVEDSFDGIYVIQGQHIVFANYRLSEMLGYGERELVGMQHLGICHEDDRDVVRQLTEALVKGEKMSPQHDIRLQRQDGSVFDVTLNARPVRFGSTSGIRVCVTDITDRKRSEELLLQTERNKAIAEMAGGVAHNFNNLLQIIITGAQIASNHLRHGPLNAVQPNLDRIVESCVLGTETVKRLQEFARVRTNDQEHEKEVFDLSASVEKALKMSEPWWRTNPEREGLRITLEGELIPDSHIIGKESEILEVILNLVKNAVEALPSGGNIKVHTWKRDDSVFLEVIDNGVGILPEDLNRVFQPFWTTKGFHGAGMGLASCFGIVKKHGGEVGIDSEPGVGTTVQIRLPLSSEETPTVVSPQPQEAYQELRVLVVDDMLPAVTLLQEGLSEFGHTVFAARSGAEALEIVLREPLDVVICDLGMPEMNGWDVARHIKEMSESNGRPKIPFVLLTGWGGQIDQDDRVVECGVDWVVEKPAVLNKLVDVLSQVVHPEARD